MGPYDLILTCACAAVKNIKAGVAWCFLRVIEMCTSRRPIATPPAPVCLTSVVAAVEHPSITLSLGVSANPAPFLHAARDSTQVARSSARNCKCAIAGRGNQSLPQRPFLALGTGTGLGLLIDDRLFRGAQGFAGEIADLPIGHDPTSQNPSAGGTFKLEVGSPAIVDGYRRQGGTAAATVRDICRLLEQGDEVAASVLDATARCVAFAVVTLQSLLDLELIVCGGRIGVRPELNERVQRAFPALFSRPITIVPSRLGDRAGLIGAVWVAGHALRQIPGPTQ